MKISEIFYSTQGESAELGMPAVFIRTSGCNCSCPYCDSKYANKGTEMSIEEIITDTCMDTRWSNCNNVIITGGEPFIQDILPLVKELNHHGKKVYVETNGTIFRPELIGHATFTVSPKLKYSKKVLSNDYMQSLYKWSQLATFKFVIDDYNDISEAIDVIEKITPSYPVYFMPQTVDADEMKEKLLWLTDMVKNIYPKVRVVLRQQIYLYGNKRKT